MKLYIKQKVLSLSEKFAVKDEYGNNKYTIKGKFFSIPKQFDIYDDTCSISATIEKKIFTIPQKYGIIIDGVEVAQISKKFTLFKQAFSVTGVNWTIKGDFLAHEYTFFHNNSIVAQISKEWFTWGDSYVINIVSPSDELFALACVIAIDESISDNNNSHSTSF